MTFNELLTFWTLRGIITEVSTGHKYKSLKKIKVRLGPNHSAYIYYGEAGPISVRIYYDNDYEFYEVDQIGTGPADNIPVENIMDALNTWIKDLQ